MRRLAAKFPPPPLSSPSPTTTTITIDIGAGAVVVGPNIQQFVEEKETALREAASKIEDLDRENAGLRAKVDRLEKEVDFVSKDRYALVRDKCELQNKLGDFSSWPEFRVEYDHLATEFEVMKRQRAREHTLQEQYLNVAKEAKLQLAKVNLAVVVSKIAHSEELKQAQKERDEAKERNQTLLAEAAAAAIAATIASTTPGNTAPAFVSPAIAATAATESALASGVLHEENTRLNLALRTETSLLSKKSSDLERMQSLLKTRSSHSVSELRKAAATILDLEEEKERADKRIAELERDVKEANEKADEMEEFYMALAFGDDESERGENEGKGEEEKEEDDNGEEKAAETSSLLKQVVAAMSKKEKRNEEEGADEDGNESKELDEDDEDDEDDKEDEEDKERDLKIHNENEDLFKDMMGSP